MTNEWMYAILFFTVILCGCSVLFFQINGKVLKLLLSFSGAYLLGVTVLHLVPEIYCVATKKTGVFILAGFLLQILIEFFSEGIEHGHIHVHKREESGFPLTILVALSFHSFVEGMPLAGKLDAVKQTLATGIILHNIPIAIALTSMLIQSGQKKMNIIFWLTVFAFMTPLGAFAGNVLESMAGFITKYSNYLMATVVGIFLHVSTTILFESSEHHRFNLLKLAVMLAGMGLAVFFI